MELKKLYELIVPGSQRMFLGDKGVTMTEAGHKSNIIKEKCSTIAAQFANTAAYKSVLKFEGEDVPQDNFLKIDLEAQATVEGDLYAYSAWLKEGLKAKEAILDFIKSQPTIAFHSEDEGDEPYPTFKETRPVPKDFDKRAVVTEEQVIAGFGIGDRIKFLSLEAKAAHLGKKLHNHGPITRIRKDLQEGKTTAFKELPNGAGMKAYLVKYDALYETTEVDEVFFRLQEQHRTFESELNYIKAKIQNAVTSGNAKVQQVNADAMYNRNLAYQAEMDDYNQKYITYNQAVQKVNTEMEARRLELTKMVSEMKIIVPDVFAKLSEELTKTDKK